MNDAIKVFNRKRKAIQLNRAARNFYRSDFLYNEISDRLLEQFQTVIKTRFGRCLNIGARNDHLSKILQKESIVEKVIDTNISKNFLKTSKNDFKLLADEEYLPFQNESFDLVISNLDLHWVNDLPGCLVQIRNILKKGGFFCATLFGSRTLVELRNAVLLLEQQTDSLSPRISPFIDVKDGAALLQRTRFNEPVSSNEEVNVKYTRLSDLMLDLRNMGETNALEKLNKKFPGKNYFKELEEIYRKNFSDTENNLDVTFEIITISGWKQ